MQPWSGIFDDSVFRRIEIPESGQARLAATQALMHSLADLRLGSGDLPDADLRKLRIDQRLIVHHRTAQTKPSASRSATLDGGETAGVAVRGEQRAIQEEFHPVRAGNRRHMVPFIRTHGPRHSPVWHSRIPHLALPLGKEEIQVAVRVPLKASVMKPLPITEEPGPTHVAGRKTPPLDPHLDRGFVEVVEDIRRQSDKTTSAVEVEDASLPARACDPKKGHHQESQERFHTDLFTEGHG